MLSRAVDGLSGLFIAIPGDAGFTLAPYCARLVVEQMAGRSPDYPLESFSPARFAHAPREQAARQ